MSKQKRNITIDQLARMSQGEFSDIRKDVSEVKENVEFVREDIRILRNDMESGFQAMSQTMKTIVEQLHMIREDIIELHDLRSRIERLEKKVGFR